MSERKGKVISGVKWMTCSTIVTAVVAILRLSILARFLGKSDFGEVAILMLVLGLTQTFADLGFASAIMHKRDLSRKEFVSLYWIQWIVFGGCYLILVLSSSWIARFYGNDSLKYLLPLALLDLIFYGIGRLYDTVLQRELRFKILALRNIICAILSLGVAILLAMRGGGIYSLLCSTLFHTLTNNLWNAIVGQKYYPLQFFISFKYCCPLIKIGMYQMGTQIVDYFSSKCDIFIIGKLLGTESLGVYSLAKELVIKVILLTNSIVNKVVLPFFSALQNKPQELSQMYIQVVRWLALVNFPISMTLSVLSTPIVMILYGRMYQEVAPILTILSIWSLFLCIGNPMGNLAIAKGRTDLSFKYTLIRVVITLPLVFITALFSLKIVAWGQIFIGGLLFFVGYEMLIHRLIGIPLKTYIRSFLDLMTMPLLMGGICYWLVYFNVLHISSVVGQLLTYGLLLASIYAGGLWLFHRKMFFELLTLLR